MILDILSDPRQLSWNRWSPGHLFSGQDYVKQGDAHPPDPVNVSNQSRINQFADFSYYSKFGLPGFKKDWDLLFKCRLSIETEMDPERITRLQTEAMKQLVIRDDNKPISV